MEESREYELVYLLRADLAEEGVKKMTEKMQTLVSKNKGTLVALKDLGKRNLSYRINKQARGHYFELRFKGSGSLVEELERNLRLTEEVLRFLTVKVPKIPAKYAPKPEGVSHAA